MSYELRIDRKPAYLHAIVTGSNTKDNVKRYVEEIMQACIEGSCRRVLIEERLEGPRLGTLDVYSIAAEGSDRFAGKLQAIAYVDVNRQGDLMQFAENVAVTRGLPLAVFKTVAEAEKWLLDRARQDGH